MPRREHLVMAFKPKYRIAVGPDTDLLVQEMQEAIGNKEREGWSVVSATSVLNGIGRFSKEVGKSYGYGYSTTDSIIVILRRELPE